MGKERQNKLSRRITAQSFCRLNERLDFARQLVGSVGDVDKAQEIFAFFCYFVAFNILYEPCKCRDMTHWESVGLFVGHEYDSNDCVIFPSKDPRCKLLNGKVLNGRKTIADDFEEENKWIEQEQNPDIKVFLRILQIRNNLFHGSKALDDSRDMPLIREANIVLREFLLDYFDRKMTNAENGELENGGEL